MGRDCASERVPIALAEADQRTRPGLSGAALGDVARTPPHGTPIRAANASLFRWAF